MENTNPKCKWKRKLSQKYVKEMEEALQYKKIKKKDTKKHKVFQKEKGKKS